MSLTMSSGPLSTRPAQTVNYRIEGPAHRLYFDAFPRRVRAVLNGRTVLDSVHAMLLHETGEAPQLYVPAQDVVGHLLEREDGVISSRYKGDTQRYSMRVDGHLVEGALWAFPEPDPEADWLRGYLGVRWDAMDGWFDEAEEVVGGLRDPYHRVDVRATQRRVRVDLDGRVLAETIRPMLVSETGLPNRFYLPAEDVPADELTDSPTTSVCPYKGVADYAGARGVDDVAWCYRDPLPEASNIAGYWCFDNTKADVHADSRAAPVQRPVRTPEPPTRPVERIRDNMRRRMRPDGHDAHGAGADGGDR